MKPNYNSSWEIISLNESSPSLSDDEEVESRVSSISNWTESSLSCSEKDYSVKRQATPSNYR